MDKRVVTIVIIPEARRSVPEVAALLPQMEDWLQSAKAGEHIHAFPPSA